MSPHDHLICVLQSIYFISFIHTPIKLLIPYALSWEGLSKCGGIIITSPFVTVTVCNFTALKLKSCWFPQADLLCVI